MGETSGPFPWVLWGLRIGALVLFLAAVVGMACGVIWALGL